MKQKKGSIPLFLDELADNIFACGKAINLLKLIDIQVRTLLPIFGNMFFDNIIFIVTG